MKNLKGYLVILILLVSSPSFAYTMLGPGAASCGKLLDDASNKVLRIDYQTWMTGYITALNRVSEKSKGKTTETVAIFYEVKNYCERNPQDSVEEATYWVYVKKLK